jgi:hypothetical protein
MENSHGYLYPTNSNTEEVWSLVSRCDVKEVSMIQHFEARNLSKYHFKVQFLLTSP